MFHRYRLASAALLMAIVAGCSPFDPGAQVPTAPPRPAAQPPTSTPLPTALAQPTSALLPNDAAPARPVGLDVWMPGNKQGVGTAFTYDQPPGDANPSRVWFGITNGAITEGLYPDVSQANIKSLNLLVTDGKSFLADEIEDATYRVERIDGRTPAYRVTSTDKQGRWLVVKEIVADPQADTVVFTVGFRALQGQASDYRLYLNYTPRIGQSGAGDLSSVAGGMAEAWDAKAGVYTALSSDPPPALATTGYTRRSDIKADLADYKIDAIYS